MTYTGQPGINDVLRKKNAEIERLQAAIRDAHSLIDNDLVIPWIIAHKLDDVLGTDKESK